MNGRSRIGTVYSPPLDMSQSTRKEREKLQHRQQILAAAETVFAEKGFRGATVQQIAERAEFSVGHIYNLFENKEGLYVELVNMRAAEHLADVQERLARQDDILAKLRTAIEAKFDFFRRHRQFFSIFTHLTADSRARGPLFMPESCRAQYDSYLKALAGIFEEGIRRGVFVEADPQMLVFCLEGMTRSVIAHWLYSGKQEFKADAPALIQKIFLDGILADGSKR
jgi:TetR/AcrR family transcriptional regulator